MATKSCKDSEPEPVACSPHGPYKNIQIGEELPSTYEKNNGIESNPTRKCGILLHPSSLPGDHGIGDFGAEALLFLNWLHASGCRVWQILSLVPLGSDELSPYIGTDATCGNIFLISLRELVKDGLLTELDIPNPIPAKKLNYDIVAKLKEPVLIKAAKQLINTRGPLKEEFENFKKDPTINVWLEDSALFHAIDRVADTKYWWNWPRHLRDRHEDAIEGAKWEHHEYMDCFMAQQFFFHRQWQAIHNYAKSLNIKIMGDVGIYVGAHSTDVWAHRNLFELDEGTGKPKMVSGVPSDGFCTDGQLWGTPLYNWKEMAKEGYLWWIIRMRRAFNLYDEVRIDHFRGFAGYWAVKAVARNAKHGKWLAGPGIDFFRAIEKALGKMSIIAEDLGVITKDVVTLRKETGAPGMAVLEFAFDGNPRNPHLPHNHEVNQVVYTGTHDNETIVGWWKRIRENVKSQVLEYFKFEGDENVHWEFIRGAISSVAMIAILPLQDVMGLDNKARMNEPGTIIGNWEWRVGGWVVFKSLKKKRINC